MNKVTEEQLRNQLAIIFEDVQRSESVHRSRVNQSIRLYQSSPRNFQNVFKDLLNRVLRISKREPAVERVIKYVVSLATSNSDQGTIANETRLKNASKYHSKSSKNENESDSDENEDDVKSPSSKNLSSTSKKKVSLKNNKKSKKNNKNKKQSKSKKLNSKKKQNKRKNNNNNNNDSENEEEQEEEDEEEFEDQEEDNEDEEEENGDGIPNNAQRERNRASIREFLNWLLRYLLDLTEAADNSVRFRSTQIIGASMAEIEDIEYVLSLFIYLFLFHFFFCFFFFFN